jgi:periplasmic protein TonB
MDNGQKIIDKGFWQSEGLQDLSLSIVNCLFTLSLRFHTLLSWHFLWTSTSDIHKFKIMRTRNLNYFRALVFCVLCNSILFIACNNANKSENNSTTEINSVDSASITNNTVQDTSNQGTRTTAGRRRGVVSTAIAEPDKSSVMKVDEKGAYNYAGTAPSFTGGQSSLQDYINSNIQYPDDAINNEVEGTVYVMFTIDENGKIENAKTSGSNLGYGLEEEAIRVITGMKGWTAGTNNGKKVKTWYTLPITYKLETE